MAQADGYRAAGWLGVVTAGLLWVPLNDGEAGADQLVQQVRLAMPAEDGDGGPADVGGGSGVAQTSAGKLQGGGSGGGGGGGASADMQIGGVGGGAGGNGGGEMFSVVEMREELERLRADLAAASNPVRPQAAPRSSGGACPLPVGCPELPPNMRVSPEMQELALNLLSPTKKTRCSFVGMGGEASSLSALAGCLLQSVLSSAINFQLMPLLRCLCCLVERTVEPDTAMCVRRHRQDDDLVVALSARRRPQPI